LSVKILLINDYATPTGGAELLTFALRNQLRERGHEARIFASSARPGGEASFADYECFGTTTALAPVLQVANVWAFWRLRQVLATFRPDVVHVGVFLTQLSPLILPLLRNIPSVYQVHWYRPICPVGTKTLPDGSACYVPAGAVCYHNRCLPLRHWGTRMLQLKLWRHWRRVFDCIVTNSEVARRRLVTEGLSPIEVVWPGVPEQPMRPPLVFPPTIAFAGRLVQQKGTDVLLRAFARVVAHVPEARLLLAGDGPERKALQELSATLGVSARVCMLGHLSRPEMERHLASAWVQAVPSRFAEAFGLVAIEAMMRGTAVVASAADGLREIVKDGQTGMLVPPGDVDAFAEALLVLLQDRELAERVGKAGRKVALERFREETYLDRFIQVYQTLRHDTERTYGN
jgi:glycosyltransferase involved in cell wall biosynthesis